MARIDWVILHGDSTYWSQRPVFIDSVDALSPFRSVDFTVLYIELLFAHLFTSAPSLRAHLPVKYFPVNAAAVRFKKNSRALSLFERLQFQSDIMCTIGILSFQRCQRHHIFVKISLSIYIYTLCVLTVYMCMACCISKWKIATKRQFGWRSMLRSDSGRHVTALMISSSLSLSFFYLSLSLSLSLSFFLSFFLSFSIIKLKI